MHEVKPIGQETVVNQIINTIKNMIINGDYKAGTKLPNEYELIEMLNVSRTTLREAMKVLSAIGIVEIRRGDGTYVCSQMNPSVFDDLVYGMIFDLSSSEELLELRKILDEATLRAAVEKATEEDIKKLEDNINLQARAVEMGEIEKAQEYDLEFHNILIQCSRNVFFIRILKGIYSLFAQSIKETVYTRENDGPRAHIQMLNCIKKKDYSEISAIVQDSLNTWKNKI